MKKILAAAAVAVVLAAGGAYLLLQNRVGGDVERGVKEFFASLPTDYTKRDYGKITFELSTKTLTVENIDLERSTGLRKIKITKLEIVDPDINAALKIVDPRNYTAGPPDATMHPLAARITLNGVQIDDTNGSSMMSQIVLQGLQGRQFPAAPTAEWRASLKQGQYAPIVLQTFRLDSAEVNDLSAASTANPGNLTIKKIVVTAVNPDNLGNARVSGVSALDPGKGNAIELAQAEIADLQWAKLLDVLARGEEPADAAAMLSLYQLGRFELTQLKIVNGKDKTVVAFDKLAIGKVDRLGIGTASFAGMVLTNPKENFDITVGDFEMRGLQYGGLIEGMGKGGQGMIDAMTRNRTWVDSVSLHKLGGPSLAMLGIGLSEIVFTANRDGEGVETSQFKLTGLEIDSTKTKVPQIVSAFEALNYQRAVFDFAAAGKLDAKRKSIELTQFSVGAPQIGRIELVFAFDNYVQQTDPGKSIEAIAAAQLRSLKFSYRDEGLLQRLVAVAAKEQGMTIEQVREMMEAQIKAMSEPFADAPAIAAAAEALRSFLRAPKTLILSANPPQPVGVMEIGEAKENPPALVELLKLTLVNQ